MSTPLDQLSRREREFYQILCSLGEATALDIQAKLPTGTKNSATRKILTALFKKGVINWRKEGNISTYLKPRGMVSGNQLSIRCWRLFLRDLSHMVCWGWWI